MVFDKNLRIGLSNAAKIRCCVLNILIQTIKCQCCPHLETSCYANHLTGFYMRATQALNGLNDQIFQGLANTFLSYLGNLINVHEHIYL